jgi:Lipoate-protein ligase A
MSAKQIPLYWLELENLPIFEQLQLEEALLRTDSRNLCIVNKGSPRAIVMGISGEPDKLLHLESVKRDQVPVIKRFSGGGTVVVDEETLFISFLFNREAIDVQPFPEPLLRWSEELYAQSWRIPNFSLKAQDYTIGAKKCGGNAQYIRKDRWLHHSSFLWDYKESNMDYLLLPSKRPEYREDRPHKEFLCRLKEFAPSAQTLVGLLKKELVKRFYIEELSHKNLEFPPHRQSTRKLFFDSSEP